MPNYCSEELKKVEWLDWLTLVLFTYLIVIMADAWADG